MLTPEIGRQGLDLRQASKAPEVSRIMRLWLCVSFSGALAVGLSGCGPHVSALDRQRLNHALTYFIYAQADSQLARQFAFDRPPRNRELTARNWVLQGLRQPALVPTEQRMGFRAGANAGFSPGISLGGTWERLYKENPNAPMADTLMQLFKDAQCSWDPREHYWHLSHAYHDDYELVRNDDRFKFFLAFYQDPFPETTRD